KLFVLDVFLIQRGLSSTHVSLEFGQLLLVFRSEIAREPLIGESGVPHARLLLIAPPGAAVILEDRPGGDDDEGERRAREDPIQLSDVPERIGGYGHRPRAASVPNFTEGGNYKGTGYRSQAARLCRRGAFRAKFARTGAKVAVTQTLANRIRK